MSKHKPPESVWLTLTPEGPWLGIAHNLSVGDDIEYVPAATLSALREALEEIMAWGIEHDDERLGYITVQVDRQAIAAARAALEGRRDE